MAKFGIVLPSHVYNHYRLNLVTETFRSLLKTKISEEDKPDLCLLLKDSVFHFQYPLDALRQIFNVKLLQTEFSSEMCLAYGTHHLFRKNPYLSHVVWMGDDALYHPNWLQELEKLIWRHPYARSYNVYNSANKKIHYITGGTELDLSVFSVCGHGLTISRSQWNLLPLKYHMMNEVGFSACWTLDLWHAYNYPGERWVTKKSYLQHTGLYGLNCMPHHGEYAENFQEV